MSQNSGESSKNDLRDELPRVSVDSVNEWMRIQSSLNDEVAAVLQEKLKEHNLEEHREVFEQHMQQVRQILCHSRPILQIIRVIVPPKDI